MSNLLILFVFLLIGILMQKVKNFPNEIHVFLNSLILHLFLPALIFISVPFIEWNPNMLSLTFVAWIIFGCAFLFFSLVGSKLNWSKSLVGCLILTAGLGNTAFVGLPIIEAAYGKEALKFAVLLDQTGTFLVCSSFGVWVSRHFSQGKVSRTELLKAVLVFPPFMAFGISLLLASCGWSPSGVSLNILEKLSFLLAPVALISVGLQLKFKEIRHDWHLLLWGLGFKLIMAPIMIFAFYRLFNVPQNIFQVAVLESAMAPMLTSSILASSCGLHPRLAGLMVGVGVPVSFLTLSIWYQILN